MKRITILAAGLLLLLGCTKMVKLYIYATIGRSVTYTITTGGATAMVWTDPMIDTATATLDGKAVNPAGFYWSALGIPWFIFVDTTLPTADADHKLEVNTDVGNASATCKVPGDFTTTFNPADSTPLNTPVAISWTAAASASWFMVQASYDTGYYYHYRDTVIILESSGTSATIPGAWLDHNGSLSLNVSAGDGPRQEKGSKGNFKNSLGYWIGTNTHTAYLRVGTGFAACAAEPRSPAPNDVGLAYLKAIAPHDEDAAELYSQLRPR